MGNCIYVVEREVIRLNNYLTPVRAAGRYITSVINFLPIRVHEKIAKFQF